MQRAIVGLIVVATLTVPIQPVAQTPPPVPIMPPSLPAAHVVNLMAAGQKLDRIVRRPSSTRKRRQKDNPNSNLIAGTGPKAVTDSPPFTYPAIYLLGWGHRPS
jgi:hypothetical protein